MTSEYGPDLGAAYGDQTVLRHVLSLIEAEGVGDRQALEFGVGAGGTLATIAGTLPVTGFDGFDGLPEDWRPGFERGMFAQAKIPQIENATVVVGDFADTLPNYDWPDAEIALVHLDSDLYSSTLTALKYCGHKIELGTRVVLDEYHGFEDDLTGPIPGEQRAWLEWVAENEVTYDVIGHGREQLAVIITSIGVA